MKGPCSPYLHRWPSAEVELISLTPQPSPGQSSDKLLLLKRNFFPEINKSKETECENDTCWRQRVQL